IFIVGAMLSINQLNLWNLDTDERKSVIIEKPYLPDQVIDIDGLENRTFFCDLEVSNDLVFALYMDQDYDISYEQPKEMTVFIFDWKLNLIKTYVVDEYIQDIAVDPIRHKLYGVCGDNIVFEYDISELFK
ncbi:MAG TPA: BF3164 family lipoprotein, partial [Sphingobacteriaceae bacterium]|nr:BF3164 family lipoprotein [Sphingobacteriaceae bacterium]